MNDIMIQRYGKDLTNTLKGTTTKGYHIINDVTNIRERFALSKMLFPLGQGPTAGDVLVEPDGIQYWLVAVAHDEAVGNVSIYDIALVLNCNVVLTVKRVVNNVYAVAEIPIHCQVTKSRLTTADDDTVYRDKVRGNQEIHYIYSSVNEDVQKNDLLVDSVSGRNLKVMNNTTPYLAEGIMELEAIIEDA